AAAKDKKEPKAETKTTARTKTTAKASTSSDDTASRRPGGDWFPSTTETPATTTTTTTVTTPTVTPTTTTPTGPAGVSGVDGPVDPYGSSTDGPGEGADKKAEFFANVGQQQLASGDTAGAAASFKKAL